MRSLIANLPLFFLVFIVFTIVRAIRKAQELSRQNQSNSSESDEQRRVREIQERIRRIAAERRGGSVVTPPAVARAPEPPPRRLITPPAPIAPLDPFGGGPARRLLQELERRMAPPPEPAPAMARQAELERQQRLVEALRAAQDKREVVVRRAETAAAISDLDLAEARVRIAARQRLLADLQDPPSIRRAFVLREVLGAPVGLR